MEYFLTYYYKSGNIPFRSLSALSDTEAIQIMNDLYVDNPIWGRFKNPAQYLHDRKETERWVREKFILKGGHPQENYPIYMVWEICDMLEKYRITENLTEIKIPLSIFSEKDVSFTFIDSMFSFSLWQNKTAEYYQPEYHGKVFTLPEILSIIKVKGEPVEGWWGKLPKDFFPYIEAQVWNHKLLWDYYNKIDQM